MKTILLSFAVLGLALFSHANDLQSEPGKLTVATGILSPAKSTGFALKNVSKSDLAAETRVPFWPIGWTKTGTVVTSDPPLDPRLFVVTSVLPGADSLAIIGGQSFQAGESISVETEQRTVQVLVKEIRTDGVVLQQTGKDPFFAELRRLDILVPKPPAQTLNRKGVLKLSTTP